jgi:hypothetical protein
MEKFYAININSLSPGFVGVEEIPAKTRREAFDDHQSTTGNCDHFLIMDAEQFENLQHAMKKFIK